MSQPELQWCDFGDINNIKAWHPNSMLNGLGAINFNEFVRNVIKVRPGFVTEMYGWYTKSQISFIGKQESLKEDLISVLTKLNLKFDEQSIKNSSKVGVSQNLKNEIVWNKNLKKEVFKLEYAGIMRYGYPIS